MMLRCALALPAALALGCAASHAPSPVPGPGGRPVGIARVDHARLRSLQGYDLLVSGFTDSALVAFQQSLARASAERTPAEGAEWGRCLALRLLGRTADLDSLRARLLPATLPESHFAAGWLAEMEPGGALNADYSYRRALRMDSTFTPALLRLAGLRAAEGAHGIADSLLTRALALGDARAAEWRTRLIPPPPLSPEDSLVKAAEASAALTRLQWAALLRRCGCTDRVRRFDPPELVHFRSGRDSLFDMAGTPWVSLASDAVLGAGVPLYPDGRFRPGDPVTRGGFALWLDTIPPPPGGEGEDPPDVPAGDYRGPAVAGALARGLMQLRSTGLFDPDAAVSGAEAVAALRGLKEGR